MNYICKNIQDDYKLVIIQSCFPIVKDDQNSKGEQIIRLPPTDCLLNRHRSPTDSTDKVDLTDLTAY
jgi:hypothetical protein